MNFDNQEKKCGYSVTNLNCEEMTNQGSKVNFNKGSWSYVNGQIFDSFK